MYQKLQFNRQKMANLPPPSHHYPICSFKGSVKNWLLIWTSLSSQCKSTAIQNTMATSTALAGELLQFHKLFHKYIRLIKKIFAEHFNNGRKIPLNNSGSSWRSLLGEEARIHGMGRNRAADLPQRKQGGINFNAVVWQSSLILPLSNCSFHTSTVVTVRLCSVPAQQWTQAWV